MEPAFPHLNLLSDFSFMRSGGTPGAFVKSATGASALGIADIASMSCVPEFGKAAKGTEIDPKAGVILVVEDGGRKQRVRLHGKGDAGWEALCRLLHASTVDNDLTPSRLKGEAGNITVILQSPDPGSNEAVQPPAHAIISSLTVAGLDLFVEDLRVPGIGRINYAWVSGVEHHGLPTIAAAPVCYPAPADRDAWRMMGAIASNNIFNEQYEPQTQGCHLLGRNEMRSLFEDNLAALDRAEAMAVHATALPSTRSPVLPKLGRGNAADDLKQSALSGLLSRVGPSIPPRYTERLEMELSIIERMGFADYFLIVSEFIGWAKSKGIAVGPGRGSGAGSLVAWCVGITGIDPLQHDLLFERFINPERVSLPDFDVDFCELRREEVIAHVRELYGDANVARIATFSTIGGKSAIKDTARILGVHFQEANEICARYPFFAADLSQAMSSEEFRNYIQGSISRRLVIESAMKIEGLRRQVGMHAAGVIITSHPLANDTPLFRDPDSGQIVLGYEMKGAESYGLVKFDFLGLSTLSIIDEAVRLLSQHGIEPPLPAEQIRLDDKATYKMFASGAAKGTFQFDRMIEPLRTVRPTQFTDLVAINALNRPGPMQFIPLYAERKRAAERGQGMNFDVPEPKAMTMPILAETFGIMVYQEQVMKIAQVCAGYSLGQADLLRRAIGKKIADELAAQRGEFINGCGITTGMAPDIAGRLFDDIERFADYGFNKSHAEAYALLGYVTAFYKVHHPAAWFAALSTFEKNRDRLAELADESRKMGARILPPSINTSAINFDIENTKDTGWAVRYGLGSVAGVGGAARLSLKALLRARADAPFLSLPDMMERGGTSLPKATLKSLAAAGALDEFGLPRAALIEAIDLVYDLAKAVPIAALPKHPSTSDLFSGMPSEAKETRNSPQPGPEGLKHWVDAASAAFSPRKRTGIIEKLEKVLRTHEWQDRAIREKEALGYIVSENPNDDLIRHINDGGITIPGELSPRPTGTLRGLIDKFESELEVARATGSPAPTMRALTCVEIASATLITPRPAGDEAEQMARLVFEVRDGDDRTRLSMTRAKPNLDAASEIARISLSSGLPVVAEVEILTATNREGFSRTDVRITKLHHLHSVIYSAPPGALIINADPTKSADPEIALDWERVLSSNNVTAIHTKATHYLGLLAGEVRHILANLNSPAGRDAIDQDGRPYDGSPSRVVLRCGPSQVILPMQHRIHPCMGAVFRSIAGVTHLTRRPMPAVSHDLGDMYSGGQQPIEGGTPSGGFAEEEGLDMEGHGQGLHTIEGLEDGGPSYG